MNLFWTGFMKRAAFLDGGGGFFAGIGKGNLAHNSNPERIDSAEGAYGRAEGEDTRTDKTLLDRERNPRDYSPHHLGPELQDESNPHIRY